MLDVAELIWEKVHGTGPDAPSFCYESDEPFRNDVQMRVPDVSKAQRVLGFRGHHTAV